MYNKDGKVKYLGSMRRGLKEGQGKIFHENVTTLYYKGEFLEGKIDGEDCSLYYENGNLKYRGTIVKGIKQGYGVEYYENGKKYYEGFFQDSLKYGKDCEIFYENSNLLYKGEMLNDLEHGTGKKYYQNGQLFYDGVLKEGGPQGQNCVLYHEDGSLKYVGGMENGYYMGYGKGFYDNGEVFLEGTFNRGKLHGEKCKIFKDNGQLIFQGGMNNGVPNGHCKEYNEKGKVITMGNFINGKLVANNTMKKNKVSDKVRHMSVCSTPRKSSVNNSRIIPHIRTSSRHKNTDVSQNSGNKEDKIPVANWAVSQYLSNNDNEIFIQNQSEIILKTRETITEAKNKGINGRDRSNTMGSDLLRIPKKTNWEKSILFDNENPPVKSINISMIYGKDDPSFISGNAFDKNSTNKTPRSLQKNERERIESFKHVPRPTSVRGGKRNLNFRKDSSTSRNRDLKLSYTQRSEKVEVNDIHLNESHILENNYKQDEIDRNIEFESLNDSDIDFIKVNRKKMQIRNTNAQYDLLENLSFQQDHSIQNGNAESNNKIESPLFKNTENDQDFYKLEKKEDKLFTKKVGAGFQGEDSSRSNTVNKLKNNSPEKTKLKESVFVDDDKTQKNRQSSKRKISSKHVLVNPKNIETTSASPQKKGNEEMFHDFTGLNSRIKLKSSNIQDTPKKNEINDSKNFDKSITDITNSQFVKNSVSSF